AALPVQIWLARGHVFVRAAIDGGVVDLEPATPRWTQEAMPRRRTVFAKCTVRQLTRVELLGKFYYNRGVEMLKDRQFAEGIELLQISLELDPLDHDGKANLVAGLNNWAVEFLRTGRYNEAAA